MFALEQIGFGLVVVVGTPGLEAGKLLEPSDMVFVVAHNIEVFSFHRASRRARNSL